MTINERIGLIFKDKSLTANEFATKLEVRSSNISHIITGRNKPSFDFLEKLISVFPEINALWLIKGEGDMYLPDNIPDDEAEYEENKSAPEVIVHGLNKDNNISLQANLFGEMETFERPLMKPKKSVVPIRIPSTEIEEKPMFKIDNSKKVSSIIVYYSNGNFEEFIPKV